MGIGWEKPVFGWIQKLQIHIFLPAGLENQVFSIPGGEVCPFAGDA